MASTRLYRTMGTPSSNQKFTISVWVKRTGIGSDTCICGSDAVGSQATQIYFKSDDTFRIFDSNSSTDLVTSRVFRDPNSWYHIVIAVDTSLVTASDRIKLYINGVQETSFGTSNYSGQNNGWIMASSGSVFEIGVAENTGGAKFGYFDGLMSHFHYVDNQQYNASVFGLTDSTTGEWKINTAPTMTMGNMGFTILKDGNTITDQSSNSNDFSSSGTLIKTEDNPSNVFATLNPLQTLGTTNRTISYGNNYFYTGTTHWGTMLSSLAFSSGKFYCEVRLETIQASAGYGALGVTDATENYQGNDNIQQQTSFTAGCVTDHRSGQSACKSAASTVSSNIGNFSNGDIVGIAADMDNKALYLHKNGTYLQIGGYTGDPTSGASKTGAITIPAAVENCMFSVSSYTSDAKSSINFGNGYFGSTQISSAGTNASGIGIFEYDVPTGYTALSTKGLNE